jgi:hypothetical protein
LGTPITSANSINSIVNQSDSGVSSSGIIQAIKNAAAKTGVDFSYLLKKATQESGLDSTAKASTSSATGLFQFTSQTWLQMVKQNGAQYGLGAYALQITTDSSGHASVADPAARQAILALRNDPQISAEMAGELDKQNAVSLQQNVGGKIGDTELYLAHFLGAGGASDFISQMRSTPNASAASVLPEAAAANASVFYDKSGAPRSLQQIYQHFAQKFDSGATAQVASVTTATQAMPSYGAASSATLASNIASLIPTSYAGLSSTSTNSVASFRTASVGSTTLSGASTMISTMLLGQMSGTSLNANSSLSTLGQTGDKKHNPYAMLAAIA